MEQVFDFLSGLEVTGDVVVWVGALLVFFVAYALRGSVPNGLAREMIYALRDMAARTPNKWDDRVMLAVTGEDGEIEDLDEVIDNLRTFMDHSTAELRDELVEFYDVQLAGLREEMQERLKEKDDEIQALREAFARWVENFVQKQTEG